MVTTCCFNISMGPYAHIKTAHLNKKINGKRRKASEQTDHFVPYPARIETHDDGIRLAFPDFEELVISAHDFNTAANTASVALLREIALRLKQGMVIPLPSDIILNSNEFTVISPL